MCSSRHGACTGGCGRAGQVVCGGYGFAGLCFISSRGGGSTLQPQRTEPCQFVSSQPWACHGALQDQIQPLQCAAVEMGPTLGAAAGLGRLFVGVVVVLPVCGGFQRRRQHLAFTAYRAVAECEWPALCMPWGTTRSNVPSANVFNRCGGACTAGCTRAGHVVDCWRYGFAGVWRFLMCPTNV